MEKNVCSFCHKEYSTKNYLSKHIENCKKKINNNFTIEECRDEGEYKLKCKKCLKIFSRQYNLERHLEKCKDKVEYVKEIKELKSSFINIKKENDDLKKKLVDLETNNLVLNSFKEQFFKLQDDYNKLIEINTKTVSNLASKAIENAGNKTFNNNTITNKNKIINSLIPLTDDYMKEQTKYFTLDHVKHGTQSLALFAKDHTFKDRIAITDASRNKFVFKDENGELISDPNGVKITDKFIEINKKVLIEVLTQYMNILKVKIDDAYSNQDTILITKYEDDFFQAKGILFTIKNIDEPDNIKSFDKLKGDFVKNLCNMLETV